MSGKTPAAANSACPRCGVAFRCGMTGGDAQCWCAALPALPKLPVPPPGTPAACYCPDCLRALKAELAREAQVR